MTISQAHIGKTQPGRLEDAISLAREGAKLVGRHGGQVRFLTPAFAGEATGTTVFSVEYTDEAELGRAMQEMSTDPELQGFTTRVMGPNAPTVMISDTLVADIPTGYKSKGGHGALIESHLSRPLPGNMEAALALCADVCRFVEANGAVNARTFQILAGGAMTGLWGVSWEVGDWVKYAQLATAWGKDPVGVEIQARSMSGDNPSIYVSGGIYQDIPL